MIKLNNTDWSWRPDSSVESLANSKLLEQNERRSYETHNGPDAEWPKGHNQKQRQQTIKNAVTDLITRL